MKKKETITNIYEHCGECPCAEFSVWNERKIVARFKCDKKRKVIKDLWGEIPKWCPLEDAE